jgi:deoxyribodipyrimidine photo-lyase
MNIFWFRRDLRLDDNAGFYHALTESRDVLPLFIFDSNILDDLEEKQDRRIEFILNYVREMKQELEKHGSSLKVIHGKPLEVFKELSEQYDLQAVYTNHDYEPYARQRDEEVENFLQTKGINFHTFKDQLIFEKDEVVKKDVSPYTVFTPYMKKWKARLHEQDLAPFESENHFDALYLTQPFALPTLEELGFEATDGNFPPKRIPEEVIRNYDQTRDYPAQQGTSRLGVHLRFGTLSIRKVVKAAMEWNETFLNELIWREFYMGNVLWHFPHVAERAFKSKYDKIPWRNNEEEFAAWCEGRTGYPIVDAGMRELNETGFMHNRIRMVTASFLSKHLLIDWRWGEAYFAEKLLDYELSSNNGGWQWAASSGCDAAPYFRIFNPESQVKKFDKDRKYIRRWVPEFENPEKYPEPIVDYQFGRERALETYKKALNS